VSGPQTRTTRRVDAHGAARFDECVALAKYAARIAIPNP
jgi:hypothetical protein